MASVNANLDSADSFTSWISPSTRLSFGGNGSGFLNFSLFGTWEGTITLQRTYDNGVTPLNVADYESNVERLIEDHESRALYRVGFKADNYTSGTASVRLSR